MKDHAFEKIAFDRRRAEHRKRVMSALNEILNDPNLMPNADCPDLVVNVREVEFGNTGRTIYVDFKGHWKDSERMHSSHEQYTQESQATGHDGVYDDLNDVAALPHVREVLEKALQQRLGLTYQPSIQVLHNLRRHARP